MQVGDAADHFFCVRFVASGYLVADPQMPQVFQQQTEHAGFRVECCKVTIRHTQGDVRCDMLVEVDLALIHVVRIRYRPILLGRGCELGNDRARPAVGLQMQAGDLPDDAGAGAEGFDANLPGRTRPVLWKASWR